MTEKAKTQGKTQGKTKTILLSATTVVALMAFEQKAQAAATVSIGINAFVVDSNIILTGTDPLQFGNILSGGTGTVTVRADGGAPVTTGTITLVGGDTQTGKFKVRGTNGQNATFTFAPLTVALSNGTTTMQVDNFKIGTASATSGTYVLPLTGSFQTGIPVGARLTVSPGQAVGTYTGSVNLTGNYQ